MLGFLGNNPFENESIQTEEVKKVCQGTQDNFTNYEEPDKLIQTADKSTNVNIQKHSKSIPCQTDISFNAVIMKIKEKFTVATNTVYQFRKRLIDCPEDEFEEEHITDFSFDISQVEPSYHVNSTNFNRLNEIHKPKILQDFSNNFDCSTNSNKKYPYVSKNSYGERFTDLGLTGLIEDKQAVIKQDCKDDELPLLKNKKTTPPGKMKKNHQMVHFLLYEL